MVVLYSIVKLGVMCLSVYIGWFMDFKFLAPCWLSLRVLLSGEPEVFVRERLERRRRKDISQKVAEYQTQYEGQDDVAFKVYLVRSWEVYREYRMFNKFDKFEVPDKDNRGSKLFMGLVRPVQVVEPEAPVLPRPPRRTPPRALPDIHIPSPPDMSTPRPRERPQTYYWELEIAVGEL
ncbi:hypothetical protein RhiLY_01767 [Ceratobasidium sp. AG-Ba]|nr:hypothetical protein RhiLY_01767 [Ceratobasidium sp. AG-Ba]